MFAAVRQPEKIVTGLVRWSAYFVAAAAARWSRPQ